MNQPESSQPQGGFEVETACGGKITLAADIPCSTYRGERVYFCLDECRATFERDPLNSCLSERLRSGRA